ncbi:MAG: methyltransferase domain-containing protein [Parvularculaceae bacterium]
MKKISHCRACGSSALSPAFKIESAAGENRKGVLGRGREADAEYVFCDPTKDAHACGLLQNAHVKEGEAPRRVAPSGVYRSVRSGLRALATEGLELISGRDCAALDIGCSDGTLLSFYPRWVDRYGVDTLDDVDQIGSWAWSAKAAFPSADLDRAFAGKKFDLVTAASVLEEIDEPRAFFARIKSLLPRDGVLAIETLYAPLVLTRTAADAMAGGVSAVYSLGVLERLVRDCELKIFRGALTDKDGGSIRLFITHDSTEDYDFDPWYERLAQLWDEENALSLRSDQPYHAFDGRARESHAQFEQLMKEISDNGETAHLLGSEAAATMLLHWAGKGARAIEAAIGHGENLAARRLAGNITVIPEAESRLIGPEYLIVPAALKREMLERWRENILQGMKLIFVTPGVYVVHAGNYAAEYGKSLGSSDGAADVDSLRSILSAAGGLRLVSDRASRKTA